MTFNVVRLFYTPYKKQKVDRFVTGIHTVVDNGISQDPVARDTLKIMARYETKTVKRNRAPKKRGYRNAIFLCQTDSFLLSDALTVLTT